jgi:TetR/AcrR family transcriptional repressor of mexJK operon
LAQPKELTPRARAKRDQIREGAQRVFLERGFAGTSTDAIASEAGVSKQTLYAYYASKEELLVAVMQHLIHEDPQNRIPTADELSFGTSDEVRRSLSSLGEALVANLMQPDYLALIRVVIAETPRLPQLGPLFRSALPERVLANVSAILEGAQRGGVIGTADREAASRMFVGALLTYAVYDGLLVGDRLPQPPTPERIEAVVDLLMKAIF